MNVSIDTRTSGPSIKSRYNLSDGRKSELAPLDKKRIRNALTQEKHKSIKLDDQPPQYPPLMQEV